MRKAEERGFSARQEGEIFYVESGSLQEKDLTQLEWMFQKAQASGCRYMLFNCTYAKEICIAALRVFLAQLGNLQIKKMKLGIFGLDPELRRSFANSGIDKLLTIAETEKEVMKKLN